MPDGKGYLILLADGNVLKFGSAATGAIAALDRPYWIGGDVARSIAVMPDGAGYLVLSNLGGVYKYGSALQGLVGSGSTPNWGTDLGRDITIPSFYGFALCYEVLDAWGGVHDSGVLGPRSNPAATVFRDRWRGIAMYGTQMLLLRNDGSTQVTN
jgi:hypothetical protein